MGIYDTLYQWAEGKGIGNNIVVIHIKDFLDRRRLKKPIEVNGYLLWEGDKDVLGLLHHDTYEPETTEIIKKYSNGIGLDLGANVGYFTLLMAQNCEKVYAFEPSNYTFYILRTNVFSINKSENIIIEKAAVGKKKENLALSINGTDIGSNSFVSQYPRESELEAVSVIRLDDYFKGKSKPNIIKMDVEGWEEEAILGGRSVFRNANVIIFENNLPLLKKRGKRGDEVLNLITDMGFTLKKLGNKKDDVEDYLAIKKVYKSEGQKDITGGNSAHTKR